MKIEYKTSIVFGIFLIFANTMAAQDSLVRKSFFNNQIQISIPRSLQELDSAHIAERYSSPQHRPTVVLVDQEEIISFKIIEMPQALFENEVEEYRKFHVAHMKNEKNLQWLGDGVKKINGRDVGFVKVIDTTKQTFAYFFFTSFKGKLLLLVYNCPDVFWPPLKESIEQIVASFKINKS